MSISPDYLIERKRNLKKLTKWRLITFVLIILLFGVVGKNYLPQNEMTSKVPFPGKGSYIASIKIDDIILDDLPRVRKIAAIEKDKAVKAVIVHMNSQGGSVVGSEMLYNAFLKLSKEKPVVMVMDSVAASGGYMAALGGDYIIAHNGTITGSIGVIMQSAEVTELAEKVGIKFNNFKSDELKASPNPTEKLTPEARRVTMESIYNVYDYFIEIVAERRKLDLNYVRKIADGRIYSGRQALELKLIDAIGDEDTAIQWLKSNKDIPESLEVVDVSLRNKEKFLDILMEDFSNQIFHFFSVGTKGLKSVL